jgi:hypothetical protein
MRVLSKPAAFTPAAPEEILRPVNPWVIAFTFLLGFLFNIAPASGVVLALKPDFLASSSCTGASRSRAMWAWAWHGCWDC